MPDAVSEPNGGLAHAYTAHHDWSSPPAVRLLFRNQHAARHEGRHRLLLAIKRAGSRGVGESSERDKNSRQFQGSEPTQRPQPEAFADRRRLNVQAAIMVNKAPRGVLRTSGTDGQPGGGLEGEDEAVLRCDQEIGQQKLPPSFPEP